MYFAQIFVHIYKQSTATSTKMSQFLTRHIHIEVHCNVHEANEVLLSFANAEHDHHSRLLLNVFVVSEGNLESLAVLLATRRYVMSFYTSTGIHACINELMHKAIANGTGMFNLPKEVYCSPFPSMRAPSKMGHI